MFKLRLFCVSYVCLLYYRDHPEFRRNKHVETKAVENTINQESSESVSMDTETHTEMPKHSHEYLFDDSHEQVGDIDIFDFIQAKNDIFCNLFANLTKTRILHSVANEAIDEILKAFIDASCLFWYTGLIPLASRLFCCFALLQYYDHSNDKKKLSVISTLT